ncbi:MAG: carboxylating nicotinate-nucleotide diphosphorylase [Candidatus Kapaibacteriales bacterium]
MFSYRQIKELPESYVKSKIAEYLKEDAPDGDITAEPIFSGSGNSTMVIKSKEKGIFSGESILKHAFSDFDIKIHLSDGDQLKKKSIIAEITGPTLDLLILERTVLNLLQRLCGIATCTNKFVKLLEGSGIGVLDTRKTIPGMRMFEKYAVYCGGGTNHRFNLSEGVMIKDNHISAAGSIGDAVSKVRSFLATKRPDTKIEVEIDRFDQLQEALDAGADGLLLDNMNTKETIECISFIRNHPKGKDVVIESSGGINLHNVRSYIGTGIDYISTGAITHSAPSIDIHAEIE